MLAAMVDAHGDVVHSCLMVVVAVKLVVVFATSLYGDD